MTMRDKSQYKYSRSKFEDYLFRALVYISTEGFSSTIDVYTTNPDKESVKSYLLNRVSDDVESLEIIYFIPKEVDKQKEQIINLIL